MILSLQYLRAVAAFLVVYLHLSGQLQRYAETALPWDGVGNAGVGLFFVISGFIMWVTTNGRPWTTSEFLVRRVTRIVPVYWIVTTLVVAIAALAPRLLSSTALDPAHVAASYLFVAHAHPIFTGEFWPVLIPGWSLNYEMFFYVVFGASLWLGRRGSLIATVGSLLALVAWGWWASPSGVMRFYTAPILLEFALGLVAGFAYTHIKPLGWRPALALLALGCDGLTLTPVFDLAIPGVIGHGVPAVLLVFGAASLERARGCRDVSLARMLGDASYSIYLTHPLTLAALAKGWLVAGFGWGPAAIVAFVASGAVAAGAIGLAAYALIERPIIAFFRARRRRVTAMVPAE